MVFLDNYSDIIFTFMIFYKKRSGFKQLKFFKNNEKYITRVCLNNCGNIRFTFMILLKKFRF